MTPPVARPPAPTTDPRTGEPVGVPDVPTGEEAPPLPQPGLPPPPIITSHGWYCRTDACRRNVGLSILLALATIAAISAWRER